MFFYPFLVSLWLLFTLSPLAYSYYSPEPTRIVQLDPDNRAARDPPNCFPALGFAKPSTVPTSLNNWWCAYDTEYAFMGFSYEVTECTNIFVIIRE